MYAWAAIAIIVRRVIKVSKIRKTAANFESSRTKSREGALANLGGTMLGLLYVPLFQSAFLQFSIQLVQDYVA